MNSKRIAVVVMMLGVAFVACKKQRPPPNTGVTECDDYIVSYEACIDKMPGVARTAAESGLKTQRESFEKAAATPEAKKQLATTCKQLKESTKAACP